MQIDKKYSTDDLAGLASLVVKLNSDLNALHALLLEADKELDKRGEALKEQEQEIQRLKRLVLTLDNSAESAKLKEIVSSPSGASASNPEHPDIP